MKTEKKAEKGHGTALVLTGGGARAAYQVGVLLAIAKLSKNRRHNPFPIICGTSAGAINAVGLACQAEHFGKGDEHSGQLLAQYARKRYLSD